MENKGNRRVEKDRCHLYLTRRMWCTLVGVYGNKEVEGGFTGEGESSRK
jgi:hypothetical protein